MIVVLNFCHHDRDTALRLLQWVTTLGGVGKHDLMLQYSRVVKDNDNWQELKAEGEKAFASVSTVLIDGEDERGWPWSPNYAWMNALRVIREKIQKPWLWMEADCVPLVPEWLDRIEAEYTKAAKPFMGAEVSGPPRRLSGVAVYPPMVVTYLQKKRLGDMSVRNEAFDSYYASEWMDHAHVTSLIQNVYLTQRDPDVLPTFPTQESLSLLDPRAVLFHRCKDGTLINRLREKETGTKIAVIESLVEMKGSFNAEGNALIRELEAEIARLKASPPNLDSDKPYFKTVIEKSVQEVTGRTPEQQAKIDAMVIKRKATLQKKARLSAALKASWAKRKAAKA